MECSVPADNVLKVFDALFSFSLNSQPIFSLPLSPLGLGDTLIVTGTAIPIPATSVTELIFAFAFNVIAALSFLDYEPAGRTLDEPEVVFQHQKLVLEAWP